MYDSSAISRDEQRLLAVTLVSKLLGLIRTVGVGFPIVIGYIMIELPTDRGVIHIDGSGNFTLVIACIQQVFDLMTIYLS